MSVRMWASVMLLFACLSAGFAVDGHAGMMTFTSRAAFENALIPGRSTTENFDGSTTPNGQIAFFSEPLSSSTSSALWPSGIAPGLSVLNIGGSDLGLMAQGFSTPNGSNSSDAITTRSFSDDLLFLTRPNVTAIGFDFFSLTAPSQIRINVFNSPSNQLTSFSTPIDATRRFFGFISTDIEIDAVILSDNDFGNNVGELVDNFTFGAAVPEPTSFVILGALLAPLGMIRRRKD